MHYVQLSKRGTQAVIVHSKSLIVGKETAANRVARKVGIEHIHAKLLPDQKANLLLRASRFAAVFLFDDVLAFLQEFLKGYFRFQSNDVCFCDLDLRGVDHGILEQV